VKVALKGFQATAVAELLSRLDTAKVGYRGGAGQRQAVGLTATTGAGKTIIATAVIEAILFGSVENGLDPDPGAVFLWMTDKPELNAQTQAKMLDSSSDLRFDLLPEIDTTFNAETLAAGKVYFLNTQKLGAKADLVKSGPLVRRNFTFWDIVRNTVEDPAKTLYLVVDEAHRGMVEARKVEEANSIIQRFIKGYPEAGMPAVPIVLGISATPAKFLAVVHGAGRTTSQWDVPPEDVKASGLIKEKTLGEWAGEHQHDAMALFPDAVRAWKEAHDDWAAYHASYGQDGGEKLVVPALIIQVENEIGDRVTATDLDALIRAVIDIAGPMPDIAFAHAFGTGVPEPVSGRVIRHIEASKIAADADARVVFFKTSLDVGWDCPRAEVMFSFRRAVDPTSIAQTIGRMVRTPLARRIEENEALNNAYVFLPFYEETGVRAIIKHLNDSGNEVIGGTIAPRRETISLPRRTDLERAVAAIEAVPSYLVPTPRSRPEVRTLADLGNFLSASGIDPGAFKREMAGCAGVLVERRDALAGDADFAKEVNDQGEVVVRHAELAFGADGGIAEGMRTVPATEESIGRMFVAAARKLTNEAASTYVRLRLAADPTSIGVARLEAYALVARDGVMDAVNAHAGTRLDGLRAEHGEAISRLSPARQARYRAILQQVPAPSLVPLRLPEVAVFRKGDAGLANHVFAADGLAFIYLNTWETDSVVPATTLPSTIGWLRNGEREGWFCVPWRDGNIWRGFFPDFLVAREDGERVVVDVIDPHDHTKPDAVGKAKGLSAYAAAHAEQLGHVDLVARVGARYRRLHLERLAIRNKVDALQTLSELRGLYVREG
jgi:type III restriction enzyme